MEGFGQGEISFLNRFKRKNIPKVYVSISILNGFSLKPSENPETTTLVTVQKYLNTKIMQWNVINFDSTFFIFEYKEQTNYDIEVCEEITTSTLISGRLPSVGSGC